MSAPTWRVVPNAYGATLMVDHACGHLGRYLYGLEDAARRDTATQQTPQCIWCRNESEIKRLTALIAARKEKTP